MTEEWLAKTREYVKGRLTGEGSGHDWWHIVRVTKMAERLAREEGADSFISQMVALLHDLIDEKIVGDEEKGVKEIEDWMASIKVPQALQEKISTLVRQISYKGGHASQEFLCLEAMVVQDADRLDALGAIGIARVMAYSGNKGRVIHDPNVVARQQMTLEEYRSTRGTAIAHFYEKLLLLKDTMHTKTGKKLAKERHAFLETYLHQFFEEWEGRA